MKKLDTTDITSLLTPSNNQLMDRFIDIRLTKSGALDFRDALTFRTPDFGLKPDITISGTHNYGDTVNLVTITLFNFASNIDFNQYGYVTVTAGYKSSGLSTTFQGEIINIYMAKPNPNGELVLTMSTASVVEAYKSSNYKLVFNTATVTYRQLLNQVKAVCGIELLIKDVPEEWEIQTLGVNNATYTFNNILEVIHWVNNKFLSVEDIKPIVAYIGLYDGKQQLIVSGIFAKNSITPVLKTLSCIGSAYMSGTESAVITAPWNPEITPGELINVNSKYFKTRIVAEKFSKASLENQSSIWRVVYVQFTFSTRTANTMTLQLTNVGNDKLIQGWK